MISVLLRSFCRRVVWMRGPVGIPAPEIVFLVSWWSQSQLERVKRFNADKVGCKIGHGSILSLLLGKLDVAKEGGLSVDGAIINGMKTANTA